MGTFTVPIEIGNLDGTRFERVNALVDTGASHTVVPRPILRTLGIQPHRRWPFRLADGRQVEYDIAQAQVRLDGDTRFTVVVFGEADETLLGATTLELFGLGVDPLARRLIPVPGVLMKARCAGCASPRR